MPNFSVAIPAFTSRSNLNLSWIYKQVAPATELLSETVGDAVEKCYPNDSKAKELAKAIKIWDASKISA